jgi:hypothetical protein
MGPIRIEQAVRRAITDQGFAWVPKSAWSVGPNLQPHWEHLCEDRDNLEPDRYLERGGKFWLRRYGRYRWSPAEGELAELPNEPYYQSEAENPYAGGITREFGPLLPGTVHTPFCTSCAATT